MATSAQRMEGSYPRRIEGAGWVVFAGVLLMLVGTFNIVNGIAAIGNSDYLVNQLLFSNLDAWGWFFLVWGVIQVFAGFAVIGGSGWAAIVGLVSAFFDALAQLSWAQTNPVWAISAMV